ncbi:MULTISPECIES: hypothetical protein [unclassified Rhodococcus (in: high G+C Gram-positive bacteria)]|uniref:hypothetical protein n=1 Tax=unclassified Rhodococcus (in: high G+C Gram-positive bacteria) TaxID=192944 RepID=UPI00339A8352
MRTSRIVPPDSATASRPALDYRFVSGTLTKVRPQSVEKLHRESISVGQLEAYGCAE